MRPTHYRGRSWLRPRRDGGFILTLSLVVTLLVVILGMVMLESSQLEMTLAARDSQRILAYNAAELGVEMAAAMASSQKTPWAIMKYNGTAVSNLNGGWHTISGSIYGSNQVLNLFINQPVGGGVPATYSVDVEDLFGAIYTSGTYRVHGYGYAGPYTRHVTADAQCVTYASFGWLTNSENNVYWRTGDSISGWVYTNDQLHIAGSPVFKGKVNSAASSVDYSSGYTNNPDFQQGLYLNSPQVPMSTLVNTNQITLIQTKATSGGINLATNGGKPYRVTFNAAGTVLIQPAKVTSPTKESDWNTGTTTTLSNTNGAIYSPEQVWVRGTVNGQATLATASGKDIRVIDDIVYNYPSNPATVFQSTFDLSNPSFDDKLGLIAGNDIVIRPPAWGDFATDVYLMASVCSVGGSFENYYYTSTPQKTLHLLGGIAQQTRGAVGQLSGTGFYKDYKYDSRFVASPPPHFPTIMYTYSRWWLYP